MNNFEHFETREYSLGLLNDMYNVPSKELPTSRITEILKVVTGMNLDNSMVSIIFANAGLELRKRAKVAPKEVEVKPKRVTKAEIVANLLGQLGITTVTPLDETGGDTDSIYNNISEEETTEQESQWVDEAVENNYFQNGNNVYANQNGVETIA